MHQISRSSYRLLFIDCYRIFVHSEIANYSKDQMMQCSCADLRLDQRQTVPVQC